MKISLFQLFKIGIGPSSSHTIGPMLAAGSFIANLKNLSLFHQVQKIVVELYGSLALTGIGHGTDKALILGLLGEQPHLILPESIDAQVTKVRQSGQLMLNGEISIPFDPQIHIIYLRRKTLPPHPNGIIFRASTEDGIVLSEQSYFSVGGGQIAISNSDGTQLTFIEEAPEVPFAFSSGDALLRLCEEKGKTIAEIVLLNECSRNKSREEVFHYLDEIWQAMDASIERGCQQDGVLPGSLKVRRRAHAIYQSLKQKQEQHQGDPLTVLDWVNLYALAVSEENASGSKVVTAPTNGAAGIIPAVIRYYQTFIKGSDQDGIRRYLLTATAIGSLYAGNASISGAEVGCQGEVGVACSMAAAGLVAAQNGHARQIEQAAEIAMEHNLGLTCDPVAGLVQIPCIERNAMGAVKAINAARIALGGDGTHRVSLDSVIKTMKDTGNDMKRKYKETSRGGLAVNVPLC
ncbi:MAG: L-serine ammonia-lyase [Deltaproteobacteria bacterium]|nr:L-serine ammonia-lyase [Deltaproteobacteria bacterium]